MELDGRQVRRVVVAWLIEAERPMTVGELASRLEASSISLTGRRGKVVSDALRWEVRRGRVVRLRRSTYAAARMNRSTSWRIRREARAVLRPLADPQAARTDLDAVIAAALADELRRRSA